MEGWREYAECRTVDPDLFFPIGSTGPALVQIEDAKSVCRRCPVREECLNWALDTGQSIGVWGGRSEAERRTLRRRIRSRTSRDNTA
ncbi:WhiB family transcriptional regulator [Streptomyces sp. NPDC087844]|uniref:WhiB family transcriptional regulator n=1 Tax=Streptomyces sp. NPDC087844 TaxID=3365805 RepID=UPI003806D67C